MEHHGNLRSFSLSPADRGLRPLRGSSDCRNIEGPKEFPMRTCTSIWNFKKIVHRPLSQALDSCVIPLKIDPWVFKAFDCGA